MDMPDEQSQDPMQPDTLKVADRSALICALTWAFRLAVGGLFIFSGFVKGVDPWGSVYKLEEYFHALGLPAVHGLIVAAAFGLCALEFLIGVMLVLGCYRKSCPWIALLFMAVMLPLTLWLAVSNPVSDCGCFGDALVLTNWETFWKNVVLTAMIVWLLRYNRRAVTVISPAFQWIGVVITIAYIFAVSAIGYTIQPMLDFRPYPIGGPLFADDSGNGDVGDFVFVYEKEGVRKEFGLDDELPDEDDGWKFVERKEVFPEKKAEETADERTFRIWDVEGNEDVTDEVSGYDGIMAVLLMPDLTEVSPAMTWKINAIYDWTKAIDGEMIAVAAGSPEDIAAWADLSMPSYEIYTADDTAIKEVARGNPSVVMLDDGKIEWKIALGTLDVARMGSEGASFVPNAVVTQGPKTLDTLTWIYAVCMCVPIAFSFIPRLRRLF